MLRFVFASDSRMKKSGLLLASMAAASATAVSAPPSSLDFFHNSKNEASNEEDASSNDRSNSLSHRLPAVDKFAPRFDGLRFIETLVTGHR